jgi:hypothetical protein
MSLDFDILAAVRETGVPNDLIRQKFTSGPHNLHIHIHTVVIILSLYRKAPTNGTIIMGHHQEMRKHPFPCGLSSQRAAQELVNMLISDECDMVVESICNFISSWSDVRRSKLRSSRPASIQQAVKNSWRVSTGFDTHMTHRGIMNDCTMAVHSQMSGSTAQVEL